MVFAVELERLFYEYRSRTVNSDYRLYSEEISDFTASKVVFIQPLGDVFGLYHSVTEESLLSVHLDQIEFFVHDGIVSWDRLV